MVTLLGRGSVSINTGGEKVYPEEVEEALKALPRSSTATLSVCPIRGGPPSPPWSNWSTVPTPATPTGRRARASLSGYKLEEHCAGRLLFRARTGSRTTMGRSAMRWTRWDSARSRRPGASARVLAADGVLARWWSRDRLAATDIRLAAPADLDTLATTVVTAFDQDPAFRAFRRRS